MKDVTPHRRRQRSPLMVGLVLIAIGALLLLMNLGYRIPFFLWDFWFVALLVLGLVGLLAPSRHLSRSGGMWLFATGLYCGIGELHLFGLGWGSAWPIFIIALGINFMFMPKCRDQVAPDEHTGSDGGTPGRAGHGRSTPGVS